MNKHVQDVNKQLWIPGNIVIVDEAISRFQGRSNEKTTIPNKPEPTGFKIWVLAQESFFWAWNWHCPGEKNGPVGVKCPTELGGTTTGKKGNKCQAVMWHLLRQLPKEGRDSHCVADNLFVSYNGCRFFRSKGIGITGTCRKKSGLVQPLADLKNADKGKTQEKWGTFFVFCTECNEVNQFGWSDSAFALMMSTVFTGDKSEAIMMERKVPRLENATLKRKYSEFEGVRVAEKEVPGPYWFYNTIMGWVDGGDQLMASRDPELRCRRGGYQALDQWIFEVILMNCLTLSQRSGVNWKGRYDCETHDFRLALFEGLLRRGTNNFEEPGLRKRAITGPTTVTYLKVLQAHQPVKMGAQRRCAYCHSGHAAWDASPPKKRVALGELSANQRSQGTGKTTTFGCKNCNAWLCKEGSCFRRYHIK